MVFLAKVVIVIFAFLFALLVGILFQPFMIICQAIDESDHGMAVFYIIFFPITILIGILKATNDIVVPLAV